MGPLPVIKTKRSELFNQHEEAANSAIFRAMHDNQVKARANAQKRKLRRIGHLVLMIMLMLVWAVIDIGYCASPSSFDVIALGYFVLWTLLCFNIGAIYGQYKKS